MARSFAASEFELSSFCSICREVQYRIWLTFFENKLINKDYICCILEALSSCETYE